MDMIVEYLPLAFSVVGVAAVVTAMTPTPKDDGIVKLIKKFLDILAANVGHAKNKD